MASDIKRDAAVVERLVLRGKLKLESPLLIGSGQDDNLTDTLVLRDKDNRPYIPGTSLAGVLRGIDNRRFEEYFGIFGAGKGEDLQSTFVISDIPLSNAKAVIRDSVRINENTGVAADGGKFDYEVVERGANGDLKIIATIRKFQVADKPAIRKALESIGSDLQKGIYLGALTRRGFGKVVCSDVTLDDYDFSKVENVQAWLMETAAVEHYSVAKTETDLPEKALVLTMDLHIKDSLIVRTGDFETSDYAGFFPEIEGDNTGREKHVDSVQMKSREDFVIPGSSIRGVIRNQARKVMQALGKDVALLNDLFGFSDKELKQRGRLIAEETYFAAKSFKQSRNKIDRFTGGTIDSALFTEIPVLHAKDSDTLTIKLLVENCESWEIGLLLLVVKDVCTGQVAFGGEKSIGRGVMEGVGVTLQYQNEKPLSFSCVGNFEFGDEGDKAKLESYVKAFVAYDGGAANGN